MQEHLTYLQHFLEAQCFRISGQSIAQALIRNTAVDCITSCTATRLKQQMHNVSQFEHQLDFPESKTIIRPQHIITSASGNVCDKF